MQTEQLRNWMAALSAAMVIGGQCASAATYTFTPTTSTNDWSSGTGWSGVPVSGADTILIFNSGNATVLPNSLASVSTNDVANPFNLNILSLQGTGPASGAGNITIAGSALRFVSNGALTPVVNLNALAGTAGLTNTIAAPITLANTTTFIGDGTAVFNLAGAISGSAALVKYGTSTLSLNGDSSSTFSGALNLRGGTLKLNYGLGGNLATTQVINFDGSGGTFNTDNNNTAQTNTLGTVNFKTGSGRVLSTRITGQNSFLTVTSWTRDVGAVGAFDISGGTLGTANKITLTGQATGFISQGIFHSDEFAFYDAAGYVRPISYTTDSVASNVSGNQATLPVTGKHIQFTGAAGATTTANGAGSGTSLTLADASNFSIGQPLSGNGITKGTWITGKSGNTLTLSQTVTTTNNAVITPYTGINAQTTADINTLKFTTATTVGAGFHLDDGQTLTLTDGGILYNINSSVPVVISGGTGIRAGNNKELVVNAAASANAMIVIGTPILANGVNPLVKAGPGLVRTEGANTFTGGVYLDGGNLELAGVETAGTSGPLGASGTIFFYGGALRHTAINTFDYSSRFSANANQTFNVDPNGQTITLAGNLVSDGGRLVAAHSSGTLVLTGTNTYNGGATFSGTATLALGNDAALGSGPFTYSSTGTLRADGTTTRTLANPVVFSGGTKIFGGTTAGTIGNLAFTGPVTLAADLSLVVKSLNPSPGTAVAFEGTLSENGVPRALTITGATDGSGQGYLFLLGPNTYTGLTTINNTGAAGPIVINSIGNDGETASSLGAPAGGNRTINLATGTGNSSAGILRYIGGTTSTDRALSFGNPGVNNSANSATVDASGYGPITWTANLTVPGSGTGAKNFRLDGTSTDANTFAGNMPNPAGGGALNVAKNGLGTWVLSGANSFTGGVTVSSGKLVFDYASNATVLHSANNVTLGGGTLELKGKTGAFSTAQTLSNVTANSGLSTVALTKNGGTGVALTLGTVTATRPVLFDLGDSANSVTIATDLSTVPNGRILIKDGTGRVDYAKNTGANTALAALTATTDLVANPAANTDYRLTADFSITGNASSTRTLRIDPSANNQTLTLNQTTANAATKIATLLMTGGYDFSVVLGAGKTGPLSISGAGNDSAPLIHHFGTGKLTLDAVLGSGTGAFEFDGTGLIDWTRAANASGAATISGVTLRQGGATGMLLDTTASGARSGNIALANGAVIEVSDNTTVTRNLGTTAGRIQWTGDGGFSAYGGNRAVSLTNGATLAWGVTSGFVPANNALVLSSPYSDSTIDFQNGLDFGNQQRVVEVRNGTAVVDGKLSGVLTGSYGGGLIKRGDGTLELTAANTYEGETWIQAGTLRINGSLSTGPAGSAFKGVTVFGGATLAGTGTVNRAITVNTDGVLAPGNSLGTLTVGGPVSFGSNAVFAVELSLVDGTSDLLAITGGLTLDANSKINLSGGLSSMTYTVATFNAGTLVGTFGTVTPGYTLGYDNADGVLTVGVIPEPSALVLVGAGLVGLLVLRRQRKQE